MKKPGVEWRDMTGNQYRNVRDSGFQEESSQSRWKINTRCWEWHDERKILKTVETHSDDSSLRKHLRASDSSIQQRFKHLPNTGMGHGDTKSSTKWSLPLRACSISTLWAQRNERQLSCAKAGWHHGDSSDCLSTSQMFLEHPGLLPPQLQHLLFPGRGMLVFQISTWLALSLHSGFSSNVTSSEKTSLTNHSI